MKREKFLTIAVVFLFALNISTLAFICFQHGHRPPPPIHFEKFIPESLGLNEEQIKTFDELRNVHHTQMMMLDKQNAETLILYFELLKQDEVNTAQKDSLEKIISTIQQQRAAITLDHFQKLKAICTTEQKARFNTIIPELTRVMTDLHNKEPKH